MQHYAVTKQQSRMFVTLNSLAFLTGCAAAACTVSASPLLCTLCPNQNRRQRVQSSGEVETVQAAAVQPVRNKGICRPPMQVCKCEPCALPDFTRPCTTSCRRPTHCQMLSLKSSEHNLYNMFVAPKKLCHQHSISKLNECVHANVFLTS